MEGLVLLLVFFVPPVVGLGLWWWCLRVTVTPRGFRRFRWLYALGNTLCFGPCLMAAGHGVMPLWGVEALVLGVGLAIRDGVRGTLLVPPFAWSGPGFALIFFPCAITFAWSFNGSMVRFKRGHLRPDA